MTSYNFHLLDGFRQHSPITLPGRYSTALTALPNNVASLAASVQGLFVHSDYLDLYGIDAEDAASISRETLPLELRLESLLRKNASPLDHPRPIHEREIGTCRDYAVMLCGIVREKSVPARVRCGFASYFTSDRYEDHWLCEYWNDQDDRWTRVDAQMDEVHREHLGITFDISDVPSACFLSAGEAWELVETEKVSPDTFGHGKDTGLWFMHVNLARDYLSLRGQEVSPWDGWRDASDLYWQNEKAHQDACDEISQAIARLLEGVNDEANSSGLKPFWLN